MNIKKETIEKYREEVELLIRNGEYKKGLEIASKYPLKVGDKNGFVITKTRLLNQYDIQNEDLVTLSFVEKENPHFKGANKMILFFEPEVENRFKLKAKFR